MVNTSPLVSAIVPTFNRKDLLSSALLSIEAQTYPNIEVLIIDDGSTDGTWEWLQRRTYPYKTFCFHQKNKGVSAARNLGIQFSNAPWVAFLDSDDEWLPDKISQQISLASKEEHLNIIHTEENWVRNQRSVPVHKKYKKQRGDLFSQAVNLCAISPSTVMIKKSLLKTHGGFNENFPVCEDYELWLRLCSLETVGLIDEPLILKKAGHRDQLSLQPLLDEWRVKALYDFYEKSSQESPRRPLVRNALLKKSQILLKGYTKHQNHSKAQWVRDILSRIEDE